MKNIGILGLGNIARKMAFTVNEMENANLYAVASRSMEKAEAFKEKYGADVAYSSYEDLVKDNNVDLVYVAVPHSHHYDLMKLCLENNKNILCEKAFTVNAKQAKEILSIAKAKKLLVAEAIWTRYLPSRKIIDEILDSGQLGEVKFLSANLGYDVDDKERIQKKELAGGALLDLTVYPLNFACMVFKSKIDKVESHMIEYPTTKVDAMEDISLSFEDGSFASVYSTIYSVTDRRGIIYGDQGYLEIENINNPEKITLFDINHDEIKSYPIPEQISGFEYEVQSCLDAIDNSKIEVEQMPHSEIIRMMELMDLIRDKWGMKFPME